MRQVTGYVLVRETGTGIPNLVVTAFDSGGAPDILRKHQPTPEVLKQLGRRISSVFTDVEGKFSFLAEDLAFPGNEPRPDLIIVVFAPEDIVDPAHPYPKAPEERVLYMSMVPRTDAGAQEAFVIRLARSIVSERLIDTGENRFVNALDQEWRAQDAISAISTARHKIELERRAEARKEAVDRTKSLSGVPIALRGSDLLVIGKANLSRSTEVSGAKVTAIEKLQHRVVEDGLKSLDKAKAKPKMRLYLTDEDLHRLGMKLKNGVLSGKPTNEKLMSVMLSLTGGVDLVRKRGMNNPSTEVLEAKYLSPKAKPKPKPSSPAPRAAKKVGSAKTPS